MVIALKVIVVVACLVSVTSAIYAVVEYVRLQRLIAKWKEVRDEND